MLIDDVWTGMALIHPLSLISKWVKGHRFVRCSQSPNGNADEDLFTGDRKLWLFGGAAVRLMLSSVLQIGVFNSFLVK